MENVNLITVQLNDPGVACEAIAWCEKNVTRDGWDFNMFWPANGYDFSFKDSKSATLFSLKWAGSV